ncbi:hypothetical protein GCM10027451_43060 [Geodermatophilus aquaeductus]|uniref:Glucanase n=1 Tax=Geodermatophilus aquaeductus TaxID=1564161 RepID=A0A521FQM7_9ACTN|nr:glycoside hydrolase family 6 protein [Geodermatophilus aquaeductus]SMO98498.1 endoglucanase [Geodermatophilus aquaeductus]
MDAPIRSGRRRLLSVLAAAVMAPALVGCTPLEDALQHPAADTTQPAAAAVASTPAAVPPPAPAPVEPVPEPVGAPAPEATTPAPTSATSAAPSPEVSASPAATGGPAPIAAAPQGAVPDGHRPLAGDALFGPNPGAAQAAVQLQGRDPAAAALLADMASVPTAVWIGAWNTDVTATVRQGMAQAAAAGAVPVFVTYAIPDLDCGGTGGAASPEAYASWVRAVAAGIGTGEAVVVVEPDTLAQLCGDPAQRLAMVRSAVEVLEANPATHTYVDAGHSAWVPAATMAERLRAAGVGRADGFSLNVSNFEPTADNVAYGTELSAALGGAHFVVDTSRNGNGSDGEWCNPSGRALGERPTTTTGLPLVDAFLWIKIPGESDGTCNGGPSAGVFWPEYALGLAQN